jgi:hypothetical protein
VKAAETIRTCFGTPSRTRDGSRGVCPAPVAQTSKSAVSPASKPACLPLALYLPLIAALSALVLTACGRVESASATATPAAHHKDVPPHGGTPVVLGHEEYHLEFVLDPPSGRMDAWVLDGEMENFVRIEAPSFEVTARLPDGPHTLLFNAVPNHATGESVGDTSQFETRAAWLATNATFDATLTDLKIHGVGYHQVAFNFPKGNDAN